MPGVATESRPAVALSNPESVVFTVVRLASVVIDGNVVVEVIKYAAEVVENVPSPQPLQLVTNKLLICPVPA